MSGHGEDAPGPPPTPASAHAHATTSSAILPAPHTINNSNNTTTTPLIDHTRIPAPTPDSQREQTPSSSNIITHTRGSTNKERATTQESPPTTTTTTTTTTVTVTAITPSAGLTPMDNHSPRSVSASNSTPSNLGSASALSTRISSPPLSLSPGYFTQVPTQSTTQLQLQVNTKSCSTSPPTLNLVPATPGPTSANSKPLTTDLPTSNPSTLSKHKGQPVLPYLVTPKEEKSHGAIWGLWDHDDGPPSKSITKVTKSSKGPPSTSGSSKVVTSMGAEAGRKALLALQSVAAEEGAPISSGGKKEKKTKKDDMHQLHLEHTSLTHFDIACSGHDVISACRTTFPGLTTSFYNLHCSPDGSP